MQQQQTGYQTIGQQPPVSGVAMNPGMPPTPWNTGLFDCFSDTDSCIEIMFCHYCQAGYQYNQLLYPHQNPKQMHIAMCFGSYCGDVCTGLGSSVAAVMIRMDVRQRLGIEDDTVSDVVMGACCPLCSTCQVYREMSIRGAWPGGFCMIQQPYQQISPAPQTMGGQQQAAAQPVKQAAGGV